MAPSTHPKTDHREDAWAVMTKFYTAEAEYVAAGGFGNADYGKVARYLDPDVVLHQAPGLPFTGTGEWRGHEGMERFLAVFSQTWESMDFLEQEHWCDDETAIVHNLVRFRARATGREVDARIMQHVRVRDGRMLECRPFYWDPAAITAATRLWTTMRPLGIQQLTAAADNELDQSALSRYEQAKSSMSFHVADRLLKYYGVEGDQYETLIEMVRASRKRGWMKDFTGRIPEWLEGLVALERDASQMNELAIHVLPGLLQTEDYARSVMLAGVEPGNVEEATKVRLKRAEIFESENPPEYWAVLCESALHCMVGGPTVMAAQLRHVLNLADRQNITIQVLPNSAGAHPSMVNPFLMLRFSIAPHYGIVYMDYLTGSVYRDDPDEVVVYDKAFRHIIKNAMSEKASKDLIARTAKDLNT